MRSSLALLFPLFLFACATDGETGDTGEEVETGDTGDTGSGETGETGETGEPTLYELIGGEAAVAAVVDEFIKNVAEDTNINWFFAHSDIDKLKANLRDQICAATGGPCTYTGGDMVSVHAGMAITDAQFDYLVADLLKALDTLGVPYSENLDGSGLADALLLALLGMKGDIVGH